MTTGDAQPDSPVDSDDTDSAVEVHDTVAWRELLAETERRLDRAGSPDPALSARRMVETASGFEGAEFAGGFNLLGHDGQARQLDDFAHVYSAASTVRR